MAPHPRDRARSSPATNARVRSIQISKSLSWLLRHGAAKERIDMDRAGYVNVDDVLNWQKLRVMKVEFDELITCVKDNEKQRYSLKVNQKALDGYGGDVRGEENGNLHIQALSHIEASPNLDPKNYAIRAVQGHSLKTVETTSLLTPITIESAPTTCVHGTFFISWPTILRSRGLKAMTRNHVHFATGPAVENILSGAGAGRREDLKEMMVKNQVVSGMRGDAQVLIYVDIKQSIEEGRMTWWKSENGVLLTEGVEQTYEADDTVATPPILTPPTDANENITQHETLKKPDDDRRSTRHPVSIPKTVPELYWQVVVGIGIGVLWRRGFGVVQEVPADLMRGGKQKSVQVPVLKKGGSNINSKPAIRVERDDLDDFE